MIDVVGMINDDLQPMEDDFDMMEDNLVMMKNYHLLLHLLGPSESI